LQSKFCAPPLSITIGAGQKPGFLQIHTPVQSADANDVHEAYLLLLFVLIARDLRYGNGYARE
jgi:hypothetical protein